MVYTGIYIKDKHTKKEKKTYKYICTIKNNIQIYMYKKTRVHALNHAKKKKKYAQTENVTQNFVLFTRGGFN